MASEIRVNKIENRSGLGPVTFADTGVDLAGIVTATTFSGSGASLTALPAAQLSGTLPALSAANLTNVPAANITGTLPAISAANLTNVPAANITGTLPALTAANLTNIPAANLVGVCTSGLTKTGGFGKVLKVQQTTIPGLATYSGASSTTYQEVTQDPFVVAGTNTNLLIVVEINGYMSHNNGDRNFRLAYKVASGSYTNINFNPNGTTSENMFGDIRGDSYNHETNITSHFLVDGTWNAGDTIMVRLETVGEGTYYLNGAPSTSDVRFGNGLSKLIFTEYSD